MLAEFFMPPVKSTILTAVKSEVAVSDTNAISVLQYLVKTSLEKLYLLSGMLYHDRQIRRRDICGVPEISYFPLRCLFKS